VFTVLMLLFFAEVSHVDVTIRTVFQYWSTTYVLLLLIHLQVHWHEYLYCSTVPVWDSMLHSACALWTSEIYYFIEQNKSLSFVFEIFLVN